jgi:hypothetical protein
VEDKEYRLVFFGTNLFLNVRLVFPEEFRMEFDVAGFVDPMNVSEAGRNWKVRRNLGQSLMDVVDILRLGVESIIINIFVVDTIFLATSYADFLEIAVSALA